MQLNLNYNEKLYRYVSLSTGQKFAMLSMKATISTIIRNFKIFSAGPEPILKGDLVLGSCNGVHIGLEKR